MSKFSLRPSPMAAMLLAALALVWTAVEHAGIYASDWYIAVSLIGLACVVTAFDSSPRQVSPLPKWGRMAIVGAAAYLLLQTVPLPASLLRAFDPNRARMLDAAARVVPAAAWAPMAVNLPAAILWTSALFGAAALFFVVRSFAAASRDRPWLVLAPIFIATLFEAALGLLQVAGGAPWANGTFNSRDHYCCFLELSVPLLAAAGLAAMGKAGSAKGVDARRQTAKELARSLGGALDSATVFREFLRSDREFSLARAAVVCGSWCLTLVLFAAIFFSLSRAGAFSALLGLAVFAVLSFAPLLPSRRARLALTTVLMTSSAVALFAFTPSALLKRLFETGSADSANRLAFWRESLPLLAHFPVFGVGLMGFESAFLRYQNVLPMKRVDFAHNDYLQYLIELGAAGFVLVAVALAAVLWPAIKGAWSSHDPRTRVWLAGAVASLVELALHSAVDFNLYVPANLLAFAWIAAFASVMASVPS